MPRSPSSPTRADCSKWCLRSSQTARTEQRTRRLRTPRGSGDRLSDLAGLNFTRTGALPLPGPGPPSRGVKRPCGLLAKERNDGDVLQVDVGRWDHAVPKEALAR